MRYHEDFRAGGRVMAAAAWKAALRRLRLLSLLITPMFYETVTILKELLPCNSKTMARRATFH
jgi:hypothetical protein